jgi:hypothetical protein
VRRKFSQKQLLTYTANLVSSLVGLEACSGAHFLGRALRAQGHDVRLIPAQFVKPFVKSNKNDFLDAEAIAEAVARRNMRFVPIKTDDQLDLQAIHRVRDRLIACRTAVINQLRAFLLERGMTLAKSPAKLKDGLAHKRRCRKLHRIGRSVVFLDEVQTFPEQLLRPIHSALDLLTEQFGASVVHSTATQPRLTMRGKKDRAPMRSSREIVPDYASYFPVIANRFRMEVLGDVKTEVSLDQLALAVGQHERVLAIVHRRKEAEELARLLGPECLHLSARMCAEHRTAVLQKVRERLARGEPCQLVATQLVEAGVDLDFPVVFRALAGRNRGVSSSFWLHRSHPPPRCDEDWTRHSTSLLRASRTSPIPIFLRSTRSGC